VALHRGIDGSEPVGDDRVGRLSGTQEERRVVRTRTVAVGTLACPVCDVPVAPGPDGLSPAEALRCPVCDHGAAVRDFLSLAEPTRPARVRIVVR
jgi:hypothetical protein